MIYPATIIFNTTNSKNISLISILVESNNEFEAKGIAYRFIDSIKEQYKNSFNFSINIGTTFVHNETSEIIIDEK